MIFLVREVILRFLTSSNHFSLKLPLLGQRFCLALIALYLPSRSSQVVCVVLGPHSKGFLLVPEIKREVSVGDGCRHRNAAS